MRISFANDMRGENDGAAIRKVEKAGIDGRASANLDEQSAKQKPGGKGQRLGEPGAAPEKPKSCKDEGGDRDNPPDRWAPGANAGPEAEGEGDGGVEKGMAGTREMLQLSAPKSVKKKMGWNHEPGATH